MSQEEAPVDEQGVDPLSELVAEFMSQFVDDACDVNIAGFDEAYKAMVVSRQIYAIAVHVMRSRLESAYKDRPEVVEQLASEVMAKSAEAVVKGFHDNKLLVDVKSHLTPWLQRLILDARQQEEYQQKLREEAEEIARVSRPIPVGMPLDPFFSEFDDVSHLSVRREEAWIIRGTLKCREELFSKAMRTAVAESPDVRAHVAFVVLRLSRSDEEHFSRQLAVVPQPVWKSIGNRKIGLATLFGKTVPRLAGRPDLIIVDDLEWLVAAEKDKVRNTANTALVELRRLAFDLKAALLVGVDPAFDISGKMRTYNHVIDVDAVGDGDDYRVILDGKRKVKV